MGTKMGGGLARLPWSGGPSTARAHARKQRPVTRLCAHVHLLEVAPPPRLNYYLRLRLIALQDFHPRLGVCGAICPQHNSAVCHLELKDIGLACGKLHGHKVEIDACLGVC